MTTNKAASFLVLTALVACAVLVPGEPTSAHCDTMDGPIVPTARQALRSGDVTPLLKWVRPQDEAEIKRAFKEARAVRRHGQDARRLADRYFLETLIRVHRMGEGAAYEGLRPAGSMPPVFAKADAALTSGSVDDLADEMANAVRKGIKARFAEAHTRRKSAESSVAAGREYVRHYVHYMHFVEAVHELVHRSSQSHHFQAGGH